MRFQGFNVLPSPHFTSLRHLTTSTMLCVINLLTGILYVVAQETILKRAADLAEVLYSMPRSATSSHQLALTSRSPVIPGSMSTSPPSAGSVAGFGSYVGHLDGAGAAAGNGQWDDSSGWSHRYPAFTFWCWRSTAHDTDSYSIFCVMMKPRCRRQSIFSVATLRQNNRLNLPQRKSWSSIYSNVHHAVASLFGKGLIDN